MPDDATGNHHEATLRADFLRQEYFSLQQTIEAFDDKALRIKTWSVTLSMAGVGAAFTQKLPALLWLSAVASLMFWVIEALWKSFQQAHYQRIAEIEAQAADKRLSTAAAPRIAAAWREAFYANKRRGKLLRVMLWPHVCLPHILVSAAGLVFYLLNIAYGFIPMGG